MSDAEGILKEQDKQNRIREEKELLDKAHRLTNGEAGNEKLQGEVQYGVCLKLIGMETLIRTLVDDVTHKREILDCDMLRVTGNCPSSQVGTMPPKRTTSPETAKKKLLKGVFEIHWKNLTIYGSSAVVIMLLACLTLLVLTGKLALPFWQP